MVCVLWSAGSGAAAAGAPRGAAALSVLLLDCARRLVFVVCGGALRRLDFRRRPWVLRVAAFACCCVLRLLGAESRAGAQGWFGASTRLCGGCLFAEPAGD